MSQQVPLIPETDTNPVVLETNQKLPEPTITLTDGQRWAVFTIISLVSFFSNFDGGIVAQSTKQIGEDLNASQHLHEFRRFGRDYKAHCNHLRV